MLQGQLAEIKYFKNTLNYFISVKVYFNLFRFLKFHGFVFSQL